MTEKRVGNKRVSSRCSQSQSESESGMEGKQFSGEVTDSSFIPAYIQTEMEDLDFLNRFTEDFDEAS